MTVSWNVLTFKFVIYQDWNLSFLTLCNDSLSLSLPLTFSSSSPSLPPVSLPYLSLLSLPLSLSPPGCDYSGYFWHLQLPQSGSEACQLVFLYQNSIQTPFLVSKLYRDLSRPSFYSHVSLRSSFQILSIHILR